MDIRKTVGKKQVICGLSGGVDSSVVAALMKNDGYDVQGITLKLYDCTKKKGDSKRSRPLSFEL